MRELVDVHYPRATCIRVVDNLSIHKPGALYEAFAPPRPDVSCAASNSTGIVYGGAALVTLTLRQPRRGSKVTKVAAILAIVALASSPSGRNRLAHLADQLDGRLVEADQRPPWTPGSERLYHCCRQ
jgi:hypothetical protein